MLISRGLVAALVLCSLSTTVLAARSSSPTLRDREQHACYHDATTLCGEFVPDEDKITACMIAKIEQVSHKCRKFFSKDLQKKG
jgi:hypothetical protein